MLNEIDLSRADLNLLVLFEAVMRERHVGRAANRLNITPSAVSHGLGRLHQRLLRQGSSALRREGLLFARCRFRACPGPGSCALPGTCTCSGSGSGSCASASASASTSASASRRTRVRRRRRQRRQRGG